ncbi:MAG: flagellar basal body P-ring formation protein FlgA [Alphaproteobacteria bacterium]|nr:flagellar basal body P-ring formation protein FlgA [Alphaproteobacteria bacterium]MCK5518945.1 flagellar basal body P-ring formation protein FlgA [Alphaproteobacteria bacterium]
MKKHETGKMQNLKRLMIVAVLVTFVASPAFAAMPRTESTVLNDRITLGDVFDGVTENADYYLAPAPALGKTVTLNVNDLIRISEALNLGWIPDGNHRQVVIRRSSGEIDLYDIQAALQDRLTEEMRGRKFDIELFDRSLSFLVPKTADKTVTVNRLTTDAVKGLFKAVVSPLAFPDMKKEVSGRFYTIGRVPVLKESLRSGDVISANDVEYIDMRASAITSSMITDASKLIGQTPRRGISAMKPITTGDVKLPVVVKKGAVVTMTLRSETISLTTQGRAMDNGSKGDVIRVMNTGSKQVVEAVVVGPQAVIVRSPSTVTVISSL